MWSNGTIGIKNKLGKYVTIKYWCEHFEEPSKFGIENGRISKLTLQQDDREVYNYDRGLDVEPHTEEAEQALAIFNSRIQLKVLGAEPKRLCAS